jgi:hypothetical protein
MVVPDWPERAWYRRALLRYRPVWRENSCSLKKKTVPIFLFLLMVLF